MNIDKLNRYFKGDSSQQEKEEIQLWLEEDEKNRAEFISLRKLYDITLVTLDEDDTKYLIKKKERKNNFVSELLKLAAAILITVGVSYYYMNSNSFKNDIETQTLHIPAGQRAELTLTDGTKVWLNALTTFTFPNQFSKTSRKVYLDGEAYFDVKHDSKREFIVNTGKYNINVLGTEFNAIAYNKNDEFAASLIRGSISIESADGTEKIILTPGNSIYSASGKLVTKPIDNYDVFLWRDGIISFKNERIEDILKKLELYYDIEILNERTAIKNVRYTGKFRTKDGVEHILNVLKIAIGLNYTKDNDKNKIIIN